MKMIFIMSFLSSIFLEYEYVLRILRELDYRHMADIETFRTKSLKYMINTIYYTV